MMGWNPDPAKVTAKEAAAGLALLGVRAKTALAEIERSLHIAKDTLEQAQVKIAGKEAEVKRLREALAKAEAIFRWYGDLHAAKPDPGDKAKRNYDMAEKCRAALEGSDR